MLSISAPSWSSGVGKVGAGISGHFLQYSSWCLSLYLRTLEGIHWLGKQDWVDNRQSELLWRDQQGHRGRHTKMYRAGMATIIPIPLCIADSPNGLLRICICHVISHACPESTRKFVLSWPASAIAAWGAASYLCLTVWVYKPKSCFIEVRLPTDTVSRRSTMADLSLQFRVYLAT